MALPFGEKTFDCVTISFGLRNLPDYGRAMQELVSMIVEKAVKMAEMMNIPVLGIVENMSYIKCPDCGKEIPLFGKSKVDQVAGEHGLDVLGKLPIEPELAEACDSGNIEDFKGNLLSDAVKKLESL